MRDDFTDAIDALDDALEVAENVIKNLKLGVSARVGLVGNDEGLKLGYERFGGDVKSKLYLFRSNGTIIATKPSVKNRQQMARTVAVLVEALQEKRKDDGASIQSTADKLQEYLRLLEAGRK